MTAQNQNEQHDNPSDGKAFDMWEDEPSISFDGTIINDDIIISPARGTYTAALGGTSNLEWVEKYLDSNRESYPDIDLNFVNGDSVRARTMEWLKEKYGSSPSASDLPE
jgi:hypothetical protein